MYSLARGIEFEVPQEAAAILTLSQKTDGIFTNEGGLTEASGGGYLSDTCSNVWIFDRLVAPVDKIHTRVLQSHDTLSAGADGNIYGCCAKPRIAERHWGWDVCHPHRGDL